MPLDDENEEVEQEAPAKKPKGNLVKIILIVLSIVLLVVGSVAATLYFAGVIPVADEASVAASDDEEDSKGKKKAKESAEKEPPIYLTFEHPFVVNFIDKNQIRYLQINVEVMSRDQTVIDGIETHMPKIKNNLLIIFSDLDFETITSAKGKQRLRDLALEEVRRILKQETGKSGLEALYFTGFVMQ